MYFKNWFTKYLGCLNPCCKKSSIVTKDLSLHLSIWMKFLCVKNTTHPSIITKVGNIPLDSYSICRVSILKIWNVSSLCTFNANLFNKTWLHWLYYILGYLQIFKNIHIGYMIPNHIKNFCFILIVPHYQTAFCYKMAQILSTFQKFSTSRKYILSQWKSRLLKLKQFSEQPHINPTM